MFIRNCWYVASWSNELPHDRPLAITIIDEPIVLFRRAGGRAAALKDCCCHRNAPLSLGRCENGNLRCMYHGLVFNGEGRCVLIPGQQHIPPTCRVQSYPVVESGGWVWVWMGDPSAANPDLIPTDVYDTTRWDMRSSRLDLQANYMLLNDNLSDMSHTAFVHEATFGGGDTRIAHSHPKITRLERGIRVQRWLSDRGAIEEWLPGEDGMPARVSERRLDQWLAYDLLAPGILIMHVQIHQAGAAAACGYEEPHMEPLHANLGVQAITPMGGKSTRYFFALGPRRSESVDNPALADEMFQVMLKAFDEDKRMLEAQQSNLDRWPIDASCAIRHDTGVYLMRRMIDRMAEKDGAVAAERVTLLEPEAVTTTQ